MGDQLRGGYVVIQLRKSENLKEWRWAGEAQFQDSREGDWPEASHSADIGGEGRRCER